MATRYYDDLPPDPDQALAARKRRIVAYWNALSVCEDSGGTTWDVLDNLRTEVTDLLARGKPIDIKNADRLTAQAEWFRWFRSEGIK